MKTADQQRVKICKALRAKQVDLSRAMRNFDSSSVCLRDAITIKAALLEAIEHVGNSLEAYAGDFKQSRSLSAGCGSMVC